ncbi:MAG: hypothetical protein AB1403_05730 [Candidatus Riflebacteria bacterium]
MSAFFALATALQADEAATGLSPQQINDIENKVKPVLKGRPVNDLPEEDRNFLFMAEVLFPDSYELFYRHGEYLTQEKADYTQAVPRLKKALELKPKDIKSLELLATCYSALKEEAEEVSAWESLREIIEDFDENEVKDLRERVMMQLERMASENAMIMRTGKRFIVYTPADSEYSYAADELTDERLEEVFQQVTGDLECIPAFKTSIVVLTPTQFEQVKPTSWAGGFASCDKSMVLTAESFPRSNPEDIMPAKPIVLHEYTHNIVFVIAEGRCPTWLNEGLAVYSETKDRDFSEFTPSVPPPEKVMTIQQLEQEFADIRKLGKEAGDRVREAYQLAGLYARFLIQSFTLAAPRQILHGLKGKQPIDGLLTSVTKMTVPQFETRFRNWVAEMNN